MGIPDGTSDVELVRRVLGGDSAAYAGLVARYRDRLGRYAQHMLGSVEDAEEVVQDTFVRAYRSLKRCEDPRRFGAWLYGILVNRCRTAGGRASRRRRMFVRDEQALDGPGGPGGAGGAGGASNDVERAELEELVRWALSQLGADYREAFLLKYVEDLEYEEMAQLTGVGVSALKMRVKRARERLQIILREAERV